MANKLQVFQYCFKGKSAREVTLQEIKAKYREYIRKYHPDNYKNLSPTEQYYAEKMFKEYIPILQEIAKLKEEGTLEYYIELEIKNARERDGQFNSNQYQNKSYANQNNGTNEKAVTSGPFYREDGNIVTIKQMGILNKFNLAKYEINIENPLTKTIKRNFIYSDVSSPLTNLGNLDINMRSYILNKALSNERIDECIKTQGGYVGKYNLEKRNWKDDAEVGKKFNLRELDDKMNNEGNCFKRSDGSIISLCEIGDITFNDKYMYGGISKIKQYKYYDYGTGKFGVISGEIDIEYLKQIKSGKVIDTLYYWACLDELLSSERLQNKEQNLNGYIGTLIKAKDHYIAMSHNEELVKYFGDRVNSQAKTTYYSNDDIKRTQQDVPEQKRRFVFERMKDACKAFVKEACRE